MTGDGLPPSFERQPDGFPVMPGSAPIVLPPASSDVDVFADHIRKTIAAAVLDPASRQALHEGLRAPDLKERRAWWMMALEFGIGRTAKGEESTGTKIIFQNFIPGPKQSEFPPG